MTETDDQDQCRAITNEGHRCTRLAKDGRFCFQHDESDETIGGGEDLPAEFINVLSDQFESASVHLSGASKDVSQNLTDIVDEAGSVANAIGSADLNEALQSFRKTVGKTAPTAGTGAAVGAVGGSLFGPVGVATGATLGGWVGVYWSLEDDRAIAASKVEEIPDEADIVSSEHNAIADLEPIQMAIKSAKETEEEGDSEWLRSTLTRERDMDAVANALDKIPAYQEEDEATQYFIRHDGTGEVFLVIFGIPQDGIDPSV